MSIHIAITRRVRPGHEAEFQQALREFLQASFGRDGVLGVNLLAPPPDSPTREYGILRSFANETERDDFYRSPAFVAWDARARTLTEGEPSYRELHGLEAWFRSADEAPPRWKMALVTFGGVYVLTLLLTLLTAPIIGTWSLPVRNAAFNVLVVAGLTWVVMPFLTRHLHSWLTAKRPVPEIAP